MPGQALAYTVGRLEIERIRARPRAAILTGYRRHDNSNQSRSRRIDRRTVVRSLAGQYGGAYQAGAAA